MTSPLTLVPLTLAIQKIPPSKMVPPLALTSPTLAPAPVTHSATPSELTSANSSDKASQTSLVAANPRPSLTLTTTHSPPQSGAFHCERLKHH